jgi:ABC-type anion transport system duplicated permease subunit
MKGLKEQLIGIRGLLNNLAESRKSRLLFLGLLSIAFIGLLLYANILNAPFVFDDYDAIIESESIKSIPESLKNVLNNRYLNFPFKKSS